MADNITVTSGTGVTVATDDDGSAQHQWVKIEIGANGSFVPVTTANGLPVQILSLPDLGLNSVVKITSLPDLGLNSSVKITSLPALTAASATVTNLGTFAVQVTSLPAFAVGSSVTVSNLASVPMTVSGTTIAITSLPDLGLNSVVKITSLPDLGLNSVVKITSLPSLAFGQTVTITNGAILSITNLVPVTVTSTTYRTAVTLPIPVSGQWSYTSTYTSAQTEVILINLSASTTAHHITDVIFSNANTHGSFTLLESRSNAAVRPVIDRLYFRDYGGAVMNFSKPLVLDTNAAIVFTSRSATNHSVIISGYTQ